MNIYLKNPCKQLVETKYSDRLVTFNLKLSQRPNDLHVGFNKSLPYSNWCSHKKANKIF